MPAAAQGLQMLFRGDRDLLNRVMCSGSSPTLEASPEDLAVIELISEALPSALEKLSCVIRAPIPRNVWEESW